MVRFNKTIFALLSLFLFATNAQATTITSTKISLIGVAMNNNIAFIYPAEAIPGRLACSNGQNRYSVNLSTEAGQAIYAAALEGRANDRNFTIYGTGACDDGYAGESISVLFVR